MSSTELDAQVKISDNRSNNIASSLSASKRSPRGNDNSNINTAAIVLQSNNVLLRNDIRVLQVFITHPFVNNQQHMTTSTDKVIASILVYIQIPLQDSVLYPNKSYVALSSIFDQQSTVNNIPNKERRIGGNFNNTPKCCVTPGLLTYILRIVECSYSLLHKFYDVEYKSLLMKSEVAAELVRQNDHNNMLIACLSFVQKKLEVAISRKNITNIVSQLIEASENEQTASDNNNIDFGKRSPKQQVHLSIEDNNINGNIDTKEVEETVTQVIYSLTHYVTKYYEEMKHSSQLNEKWEKSVKQFESLSKFFTQFIHSVAEICNIESNSVLINNNSSHVVDNVHVKQLSEILVSINFNTELLKHVITQLTDQHHYESLSNYFTKSLLAESSSNALAFHVSELSTLFESFKTEMGNFTEPLKFLTEDDNEEKIKLTAIWFANSDLDLKPSEAFDKSLVGASANTTNKLQNVVFNDLIENDPRIFNKNKLLLGYHTHEEVIIETNEVNQLQVVAPILYKQHENSPIYCVRYKPIISSYDNSVVVIVQSIEYSKDLSVVLESKFKAVLQLVQFISKRLSLLRQERSNYCVKHNSDMILLSSNSNNNKLSARAKSSVSSKSTTGISLQSKVLIKDHAMLQSLSSLLNITPFMNDITRNTLGKSYQILGNTRVIDHLSKHISQFISSYLKCRSCLLLPGGNTNFVDTKVLNTLASSSYNLHQSNSPKHGLVTVKSMGDSIDDAESATSNMSRLSNDDNRSIPSPTSNNNLGTNKSNILNKFKNYNRKYVGNVAVYNHHLSAVTNNQNQLFECQFSSHSLMSTLLEKYLQQHTINIREELSQYTSDNVKVATISITNSLFGNDDDYGSGSEVKYVLLSVVDTSYVVSSLENTNNQSTKTLIKDATFNENCVVLLAEIEHPPTSKEIQTFKTSVNIVTSYVNNYNKQVNLVRQHAEIQSISQTLADTSQQLIKMNNNNSLQLYLHDFIDEFESNITLSKSQLAQNIFYNAQLRKIFKQASLLQLLPISRSSMDQVKMMISHNSHESSATLSSSNNPISTSSGTTIFRSIENASYYFGSRYIADSLLTTEALENQNKQYNKAMRNKLASLALVTSSIIICDSLPSGATADALTSTGDTKSDVVTFAYSLFVPIFPHMKSLPFDSDNDLNYIMDSLYWDSIRQLSDIDGNRSNDGWVLQLAFPNYGLRQEYIASLTSYYSANNAFTNSLVTSKITTVDQFTNSYNVYPYLLQNFAHSMRVWYDDQNMMRINGFKHLQLHVQQQLTSIFESIIDELTQREDVSLNDGTAIDDSNANASVNFLSIDKIGAIVSHITKEISSKPDANKLSNTLTATSTNVFPKVDFQLSEVKLHWNSEFGGVYTSNNKGNVTENRKPRFDFEFDEEKVNAYDESTSFSSSSWSMSEVMSMGTIDINDPTLQQDATMHGKSQVHNILSNIQLSLYLLCKFNHWKVKSSTLPMSTVNKVLSSKCGLIVTDVSLKESAKQSTNKDGKSTKLNAYNSPDSLDRLYVVTVLANVSASDQPAIIEMKLEFVCTEQDIYTEISLEELIESVVVPCESTFQIIRSAIAQTINHNQITIKNQQNMQRIQHIIQIKKQKLEFIYKCLALLTAEGSKVNSLLQGIQEAYEVLEFVNATTLTVKDSITDKILYQDTMNYNENRVVINDNLNMNTYMSSMSLSTSAVTPMSKKISFIDATHPLSHHKPVPSITIDTNAIVSDVFSPVATAKSDFMFFSDNLTSDLNQARLNKQQANEINNNNNNNNNRSQYNLRVNTGSGNNEGTTPMSSGARKRVKTVEIGFECYEVSGTIVLNLNHSILARASSTASDNDDNELSAEDEYHLIHTVTRSMARRVFELHRGNKNKKLMAIKQEQLALKNHQLAEKDEKVENLELTKNMTEQELQLTATETEKLKILMQAETKSLKEALKQKRDLAAHLRQSLIDMRRESDKKESILMKQIAEMKEKVRLLQTDNDKGTKEMKKVQSSHKLLDSAKSELTIQVNDLQRQLAASEATVKTLRGDVESLQHKVATYQIKENAILENDESKLRALLVKIKSLDEEVITTRRNNTYLKKQLENCTQSMNSTQQESAQQLQQAQAKNNELTQQNKTIEKQLQSSLIELKETENQLYQLSIRFKQEESRCKELNQKVAALEQEKNNLLKSWGDNK